MRHILFSLLVFALPVWAQEIDHPARMSQMIESLREEVLPSNSETLIQAFVAAEDKNFYTYEDRFSPITLSVAIGFISADARSRLLEGAYAGRLELDLSRDQILASYLNRIYLGNDCFGVQDASLAFFGKTPDTLNLREAALMAKLPKAPSLFIRSPERWVHRMNMLLSQMADAGLITADQKAKASFQAQETPPELGFCAK